MDFGPDAEIDHGHMVPPYRQLASILRARIDRGDYRPGRAIPSEARLVQEFGLARDTVRKAVRLLADDGLVIIVPQRGVFVAEHPSHGKGDRSE
ncbi:winged helix-turn-helix domain-containing protein [Actinopolymorpha sp. B17G11]|uniref:winged helix-turn-helix domain-containing protein n=1 Tax=unclassified Actinopolymorpha TaxID=2627063 RepID=UPI0032D9AB95